MQKFVTYTEGSVQLCCRQTLSYIKTFGRKSAFLPLETLGMPAVRYVRMSSGTNWRALPPTLTHPDVIFCLLLHHYCPQTLAVTTEHSPG
jgi:hypothetical protein